MRIMSSGSIITTFHLVSDGLYAAETVLNVMPILYAKNIRQNLLFWQNKNGSRSSSYGFSAKHPMCVCVSHLCLYSDCIRLLLYKLALFLQDEVSIIAGSS